MSASERHERTVIESYSGSEVQHINEYETEAEAETVYETLTQIGEELGLDGNFPNLILDGRNLRATGENSGEVLDEADTVLEEDFYENREKTAEKVVQIVR